ncbi:MAG: hypothetical protein IH977_15530 [Nitrospinae bacterium]|nr:hypothetical protein [Nitrospinota bacterium]
MNSVTLKEQIVEWLERRREEFLNAAQIANIPLSIQMVTPVVSDLTETSFHAQEKTIQTSPLAIPTLAFSLRDKVEQATDSQESPASDLYETYGGSCKVWSILPHPRFEDDPRGWIDKVLLRRVVAKYLFDLSSLEIGNRNLAEQLAEDLINLIEGENVNFVTALPLAGLRLAEDTIEVENVRLRKLTPEEFAIIGDLSIPRWLPRRKQGLSPPFPSAVKERSVLEVRTPCGKLVQPRSDLQPQKLVLALEILGFELHGAGFATTWTEPGLSLWEGGQRFVLGGHGMVKECTTPELSRALEIARRISDGAVQSPSNRGEVVLHRFLLGGAEDNPADRLIDYVIAIEGFLLPPGGEGEYRFKFALYGAWYLAVDPDERPAFFKDLQDIYDTRSRIVHGSTPEPKASINEKATRARGLAARLLVKALEEGWPSHEALKTMALGLKL